VPPEGASRGFGGRDNPGWQGQTFSVGKKVAKRGCGGLKQSAQISIVCRHCLAWPIDRGVATGEGVLVSEACYKFPLS